MIHGISTRSRLTCWNCGPTCPFEPAVRDGQAARGGRQGQHAQPIRDRSADAPRASYRSTSSIFRRPGGDHSPTLPLVAEHADHCLRWSARRRQWAEDRRVISGLQGTVCAQINVEGPTTTLSGMCRACPTHLPWCASSTRCAARRQIMVDGSTTTRPLTGRDPDRTIPPTRRNTARLLDGLLGEPLHHAAAGGAAYAGSPSALGRFQGAGVATVPPSKARQDHLPPGGGPGRAYP